MELYKKYRPKNLDRMVGCEGTVAALENMLTRGTLPRTLLFHGPSGCGKTTLARIVKDRLGCHEMDFRELNSASFRGIETVRDVQNSMYLAPAAGPCRVWLFDEAHKWSNDAQNAMLKLLEDTPDHVYFLLATTDPEKLIKAIRTRCCEMPVRLLTYDELDRLCQKICKREGLSMADAVRDSLVAAAQGSARSLLVLLDKVGTLEPEQQAAAVEQATADQNEAIELCRALIKREPWKKVVRILENLKGEPEEIRWAVLGYARVVLMKGGEWQAYNVITCFERPFYDSKGPGLVAACFEAVSTKQ